MESGLHNHNSCSTDCHKWLQIRFRVFASTKLSISVLILTSLVLIISPGGLFVLANGTAESYTPPEDVRLYENPDFGIALSYPSDWELELDLNLPPGGIAGFVSPSEDEEGDFYNENFEILYNNLPRDTTLDSYTNSLIQRYSTSLDNFTIIESSEFLLTNSSISSQRLVFSFTDGDFNFKALNTWSVIGDKALITIYYAEPQEDYETFLPSVEKMLESLQVNPGVFGKPEPAGRYVIPSLRFEAEIPHDWISIDKDKVNISTLLKASPTPVVSSNSTDRVVMFLIQHLGNEGIFARQFQNHTDSDFVCGRTITTAVIAELNEDVSALASELDCSDNMTMKKIKSYMVASNGVTIIIGYAASSDVLYERYLGDFEQSILGLQLSDATKFSDPDAYAQLLGLAPSTEGFEINGTLTNLTYASNLTLTDITLDQEEKRLSFDLSPTNAEVNGSTASNQVFLSISDILQGPYAVTINDNSAEDNLLTVSDAVDNGNGYLILTLDEKNRDDGSPLNVEIVGTRVVPEFSVGFAVLVAFGLALTVATIAQTRKSFLRL